MWQGINGATAAMIFENVGGEKGKRMAHKLAITEAVPDEEWISMLMASG